MAKNKKEKMHITNPVSQEQSAESTHTAEKVQAEVNKQTGGLTEEQTEDFKNRIAELEDKNLRMMAEFENYRRRTNKEKLDLMASAGEGIFRDMLPLVDDFERALQSMKDGKINSDNVDGFREGVELIYKKFISFLEKENVHVIETDEQDFNTDYHEAITTFAAGEDKKGKIIDCTQKGYMLGEKVIRYAKVVVGE